MFLRGDSWQLGAQLATVTESDSGARRTRLHAVQPAHLPSLTMMDALVKRGGHVQTTSWQV